VRTRIFNKMNSKEVESYLARGGKTIYIAVGVTEVHGIMPIDCETILAEAAALEMAEQSDGLAFVNLPYFFPGGTIIGNSTVQVSVRDGIDYLMMICRSLIDQGFERLIFVTGHAPSVVTIHPVCRDLFQETKVHACHIDLMHAMSLAREKGLKLENGFQALDKLLYGAYLKMDQMNFLPVDPDGEEIVPKQMDPDNPPPWRRLSSILRPLGGIVSIYYENLEDHGGGKPFASEEDRLVACQEGLKILNELVSYLDLKELLDAIDEYHAFVRDKVLPKFPRLTK
jgi:creatinine amidohydrolase